MIKAIIKGVMSLIISLVDVLLAPIDTVISTALPSLANALNLVNNFFDFIGGVVPFVISYTGINEIVLNIVIDLSVFILTVPLMVSAIKLAIRWYDKLKL